MELMNWRKATYSGNGGNCIEVANGSTMVAVRDSNDQDGTRLAVSPEVWRALTRRIQHDSKALQARSVDHADGALPWPGIQQLRR